MTFGINILLTLHDFDYSFILQDFLAKRESMFSLVILAEDSLVLFLSSNFEIIA